MERDVARMRDQVERDQKFFVDAADKALARSWITRALALPPGQRLKPVDDLFGGRDGEALAKRIDEIYAASRVFDLATRKAMFDETPDALQRTARPTGRTRLGARRRAAGPQGPT